MQQLRLIIAKNYFLLKIFTKIRAIIRPDQNETGGTSDPAYCYALFLRTFNYYYMYNKNIPKQVLEVGCGDSNIVALLWLLIGSEKVYSVDAYEYLKKKNFYNIFDLASDLLINKSFSKLDINPKLNIDVYEKLWNVIESKDTLIKRKKIILEDIKRYQNLNHSNLFSYNPNYTTTTKFDKKFNLIFSQAVFEHVKDPKAVLSFLHKNLDNNGIIYTSVDFKSHGVSTIFNGHYLLTEDQYVTLSSPYVFRYINRLPPSYFNIFLKENFQIIDEQKTFSKNFIKLSKTNVSNLTKEDLEINSTLYITTNKN